MMKLIATLLITTCVYSVYAQETTNPTVDCKNTFKGTEYMGTRSTTRSGYTCQRWNTNTPHTKSAKSSNPLNFPEKNLDAAANYCRNPDGESSPWCYTTNPSVRYELCYIPLCSTLLTNKTSNQTKSEECRKSLNSKEYNGTQSTTMSGYTCQRWNSNTPHNKNGQSSDPLNFPEKNLDAAVNFCRSPDGGLLPWCYTTDPLVRYENCDIPLCKMENNDSKETKSDESGKSSNDKVYNGTLSNTVLGNTSFASNDSKQSNSDECLKSFHGKEYNGTLSTTMLGYTCQRWNLDTPHKKHFILSEPHNFPEKNLDKAENYCRNPDGKLLPWCYTTNPSVRIDFCNIPLCNTSHANIESNKAKSELMTEVSKYYKAVRFDVKMQPQFYTVPLPGCYIIRANGAKGGDVFLTNGRIWAGKGATVETIICNLSVGQQLTIIVGQGGADGTSYFIGGGGGGGSFVYDEKKSPPLLYLAAGGSGGGSKWSNLDNSGQESENGQDGSLNPKSAGIDGNGGICTCNSCGGAGAGWFSSGKSVIESLKNVVFPGNSRENGWSRTKYRWASFQGGYGGGGSGDEQISGAGGGYSGGGCSPQKGGGGGSFCNSSHAVYCKKTGGGNLEWDGSVTIMPLV